LSKLQDYYARHQVFPSYLAIGKIVGLKSTSSVSALLSRLKDEGYLEAKDRRLRPGARFFERPLVQSRVAAGWWPDAGSAPPPGLEAVAPG
jgi:repressor LexA